MNQVLVLHNAVSADAGPDDGDVLEQVATVGAALDELGHEHQTLACDLDLEALRQELVRQRPEVVFNLVESLAGHDRLLPLVPALLEALRIPYCGSSASALALSTGKLSTRRRLSAAGVPMPRLAAAWPQGPLADSVPYNVIVKSTWQHGSAGLDAECVLEAGTPLRPALQRLAPRLGGECVAEEFIDGRELNLSLLEGPRGWRCLPPAEIRFDAFPSGRPRIVGHEAKWCADSFEYQQTPRTFEFSRVDRPLLRRAEDLALETVALLGLGAWARVDFRVGPGGDLRVLEANANPCLSPDAGFRAALEQAGIGWSAAVASILERAFEPAGQPVEGLDESVVVPPPQASRRRAGR
jgi:D-alanine-D-alanine ligase